MPDPQPHMLDGIQESGRGRLVIEAAERCGITRPLRTVHDRLQPSLNILAYHRVMPVDVLNSYPLDPELISTTPAQLDWQMAYLRKHMSPVSLADIQAHLDGHKPLPPDAVAITFDDGFSDTYRYAYPILKRYAIPAIVFVPTGYVDSGEPYWFEVVAFLARQAPVGSLYLAGHEQAFPLGNSHSERLQSLARLHELLKAMPNPERVATVSSWQKRFAGEIAHGATRHGCPMTWAQVREMAKAGIDFGSHSISHPNLTQVTDAELARELKESKATLEAQLQHRVESVAYPIGTSDAFDDRVMTAANQAGYQLGISYLTGANPLAKLDRFALRRHGVGLRTSAAYFRALTRLPAWVN